MTRRRRNSESRHEVGGEVRSIQLLFVDIGAGGTLFHCCRSRLHDQLLQRSALRAYLFGAGSEFALRICR